jgi:hypothetical protein
MNNLNIFRTIFKDDSFTTPLIDKLIVLLKKVDLFFNSGVYADLDCKSIEKLRKDMLCRICIAYFSVKEKKNIGDLKLIVNNYKALDYLKDKFTMNFKNLTQSFAEKLSYHYEKLNFFPVLIVLLDNYDSKTVASSSEKTTPVLYAYVKWCKTNEEKLREPQKGLENKSARYNSNELQMFDDLVKTFKGIGLNPSELRNK